MASEKRERLRRTLVDQLESLHQAGVLQVPKARQRAVATPVSEEVPIEPPSAPTPEPLPAMPKPAKPTSPAPKPTPPRPASLFEAAESTEAAAGRPPVVSLEVLQQQVAACTRCNELAST